MKKLIATLFITLAACSSYGQKSKTERQKILDNRKLGIVETPKEVVFKNDFKRIAITKDGIQNVEQIIKIDSLNAAEIYKRVFAYIQRNYRNPNSVSKGDIENEFISFNGMKPNCIDRQIVLSHLSYSLEYYFDIDIKDDRIKVRLSKAVASTTDMEPALMSHIDYFNISRYNFFKDDGTPRKGFTNFIDGFNENINEVVDDLIISIKTDSKKSDW